MYFHSYLNFRDPHFNAGDIVRGLRSELRSWRRVFWRVWGMVHPLHCSLCSSYFPAYMNEFCSFHPQDPEFPAIQFKNASQPFGRYPCCQAQVFRYQPVGAEGGGGGSGSNPGGGCQSRDHRVKLKSDQVR